jgi:hypothetical protein
VLPAERSHEELPRALTIVAEKHVTVAMDTGRRAGDGLVETGSEYSVGERTRQHLGTWCARSDDVVDHHSLPPVLGP